jgi:hypothetical protein
MRSRPLPCLFFKWGCTSLRALPPGGRLRHARSEKSFLARACRAKKRIQIYFASANAKVCDAFLMQMAYAPYGTFAACGRRGLNFWAGNAEASPAFLYLRKALGDGREGIPFFQLTGYE